MNMTKTIISQCIIAVGLAAIDNNILLPSERTILIGH